MNSGKTAIEDGHGDHSGHRAEPLEANTGLRILESGRFRQPQEGAHADIDTLNPHRTFLIPFIFNVPARDRSDHHEYRYL